MKSIRVYGRRPEKLHEAGAHREISRFPGGPVRHRWGTRKLTDLDFADDIALISDSPGSLQSMTTELQGNAAKVGLRISAEKTKVMAVGNTQTVSLSVEHKDIEFVEHFQYLCSNISRDGTADYDIYTRIGKASSVHRRLRPVWRSKKYQQKHKDAPVYVSCHPVCHLC